MVYVDEVRMCDGRRFQADGATTEKELLESWRLNRGTIKSPHDVDRSRVPHTIHTYIPQTHTLSVTNTGYH